MHLDQGEPAAHGWGRLDDLALHEEFERRLPASGTRLVLVDGRSGAGKTTAAERIAAVLEAAVVLPAPERPSTSTSRVPDAGSLRSSSSWSARSSRRRHPWAAGSP